MSKAKKDDADLNAQTVSTITSVIVTALDPIYVPGGQRSYGFVVTLDGADYSFRTDVQGYLQLNDSGRFDNKFILSE
jgi:hypothetical protein